MAKVMQPQVLYSGALSAPVKRLGNGVGSYREYLAFNIERQLP